MERQIGARSAHFICESILSERAPHASIYGVLYLPYGAVPGYVTVAVGFLGSRHGVPVRSTAELAALVLVPAFTKVLWSPIPDTTLTRRTWYVMSAVACAVGLLALTVTPVRVDTLPLLSVIILLASTASMTLGMSLEGLMAHATPDDEKGHVGGWLQTGNLGGVGLGGGFGLWLTTHLGAPWQAGLILALLVLIAASPIYRLPATAKVPGPYLGARLITAGRDIWSMVKTPGAILASAIFLLPLGTTAATNLWGAISKDWGVSADVVSLVTGVLGGLVSVPGCLIGSAIARRRGPRATYLLGAGLLALTSVAMALGPRVPATFVIGTLVYGLFMGIVFAAVVGVILQAIGRGAACAKATLFFAMANVAVWYMTLVEGWSYERWGANGVLLMEAGLVIPAMAAFTLLWRRMSPADRSERGDVGPAAAAEVVV